MLRTAYRGFASTITLVAALLTLSASSVAASDNNKKPLSVSVSAHAPASKAKAVDAMGHVPLAFEANQGQTDSRVQYLSRGAGYTLFLTRDEAVLSLTNAKGQPDVLRIKLNGTDSRSKVTALERLGWNTNYFIGKDPAKWRTNVPNYRKVQFDSVYPGVSLIYYGNQRQLEHDFVVAPHADPKNIAMEIAGAIDLSIAPNGDLVIKTKRGDVRFEKPIIFQDVDGARKDVAGKFVLRNKKNVGFEIAEYDKSRALIIDPVINFGTLLGTNVSLNVSGLAVDAAGNSYVAGTTQATSFPAPAPAPGTSAAVGPSNDVYVVKVSADGSSLGYVSFIGSSGTDVSANIALDSLNNAYLTGAAACTNPGVSSDFPTTPDAFQPQTSCPGTQAAFLTVLAPDGASLAYSTLYGGNNITSGLAVSALGNQAYITGATTSTTLPTSASAASTTLSGAQDAFFAHFDTGLPNTNGLACVGATNTVTVDYGVPPSFIVGENIVITGVTPASFNAPETVATVSGNTITYVDAANCTVDGTGTGGRTTPSVSLAYGSYLGGTTPGGNGSLGQSVVAAALNKVYVGGFTTSSNFPTVGAAQGALSGTQDGFITEFDPTQSGAASEPASTYVGGSGSDTISALALDGSGNVYATGFTNSTDFPNGTVAPIAGAAQGSNGGGTDAFVTELPGTLASFTKSTYLGGTGNDVSLAIGVTASSVWIAGQTTTPTADAVFNTNAIDDTLSGTQDGFIAKFDTALSTVQVSTYFGGNGNADAINALVATAPDTVYVAGNSDSTNLFSLGGTTASAYEPDLAYGIGITSASRTAGVVTVTTAAAIPLSVGQAIAITGVVPAGATSFNGSFTVASVIDPTDFTYAQAVADDTGTGGTATATPAQPVGFVAQFSANNTVNAPATNFFSAAPTDSIDPIDNAGTIKTDYVTTVTNNSATPVTNTTLDMQFDLSQLAVDSVTPSTGSCSTGQPNASSGVTCQLGTLAAGAAPTVDVQLHAICGATCPATITPVIRAASAESGNNATAVAPVINISSTVADIALSAISAVSDVTGAGKFVVQKDSTFTYSYTATNNGPSTSGTFTLTNTLPTGFTVTTPLANQITVTGAATSASCAAQAGTTVTCTVVGLTNGSLVTVTLAGDPTSLLSASVASTTNQLNFSAVMAVSAASFADPTPGNNTASSTGNTLERDISLSIPSMTATPDVNSVPGKFIVDSDSTITYSLSVQNAGPSNATNVLLTINFPANSALGVQPIACGGGSAFVPATGVETCVIGNLSNVGSTAINFSVTPPALAVNTASTPLNTTATLSTSPVSAVDSGTDTNNANLTQERDINLSIPTMTETPNVNNSAGHKFVVDQDSTITYAVTVKNAGPSNATNVVMTINFPPNAGLAGQPALCNGTTSLGLTSSYVPPTGVETCVINTLANSGTSSANFVITPPTLAVNAVSAALNASATMTTNPASAVDAGAAANSANTTQERDINLSIPTMTATPDVNNVPGKFIADSDSTITYALTAKNAGPSNATNVVMTINFPANSALAGQPALCGGTTSLGLTSSYVPATGVETCVINTLANTGTSSGNFLVTPPALSANAASAALNASSTMTTNPVSAVDAGAAANNANLTQERDVALSVTSMTANPNVNVAGPFVLQQDSSIAYAIALANAGPSNSTNTVLTVNFPANSTLSGGQPAACNVGAAGSFNSGTGVETCNVGTLNKGATPTINFTLIPQPLSANAPSTPVNSTSSAGTASAVNTPGTTGAANLTEERVAVITSSVVASGAGTDVAEQKVGSVSYTVKAHNAGPSDATNVRLRITLDTGVVPNFTSLLGTDGAAGCSTAGQTVTCTSATPITAGTDYTVTFTATAPLTINGNAAPATQAFSTNVTGDTFPVSVVQNIGGAAAVPSNSNAATTIERRSDLSVGALTATAGPTALSGSISFDLTSGSTNTNYAIPGVTVVYTLVPTGPAASFASGGAVNVGLTTGAACVNSTPAPSATLVYTCTIANLANAGQAIHLVIGTPTTDNVNAGTVSTAAFTSSACISGPVTAASDPGNGCGVGSNNLSTTSAADPSSQIQRQADLDITTVPFAGAPNPVSLAGPLTYTYTIKNNGPDAAVNVLSTITETSSVVTTPLVVGAPSNAACVRNVNNIDCTVASLANGASVAITVPITPPVLTSMTGAAAVATDSLSGVASLKPQVSTTDTSAGNNTNATTVNTTLQRTADVNIAAQPFTATSSAASNAGAVTGTSVTTNLTGTMSMTFGLTNAGPDTALNSNVVLTNVSGAISTPIAGIASSAGSNCTLVGANIQCVVASVPTGPATTITVNFTPITPTSMTLGGGASPTGTVTSTAALAAQTSYVDGNAGNDSNATTVTTNLQRQSNIQMNFAGATFTVTPSPVDLTGLLTYTYNYKNLGPDPALKLATDISLTAGPITTPFAFQVAGSTVDIGAGPVALANAATNGCQVTGPKNLDCEVDGPIPVGIGNGFVLKVKPPLTTNMAGGAATDAIFNNLSASSTAVVDNNLADNASPTQVTTSIQRTADLAVTAAAATPFTPAPAADVQPSFIVQKDATIHFDYTVINNGPSDSPATVLTIALPAGSTLPGPLPAICNAGGAGSFAGNTITCNIGTLTVAAGATPISFNVTPPALSAGSAFVGLSAQGSITGGVIDNTPANNALTALITQERDVALTIPTMTAAPDVSGVGQPFVDGKDSTISYSISVANGGPSDATNVVLTLNLPAGSLLPAQPAACGGGSNYNAGSATETCNIGTIANGANMAVLFVVTPPALAANTATTVLSALASLNTSSAVTTGNSSNAVNVTQERDADLSATIAVPVTTLDVGPGFDAVSNGHQQVTYTIVASNAGPSPATGVIVTDVLPTGFNFTSFTSTLGGVTCAGAGSPVVVTCNFNAAILANGASNTITITATATAASLNNALSSNIVTNNASAASTDLNDPNPGNNGSPVPASVTLHGEADVSISGIIATPVIGAPLHVGDDLVYAVTVHNAGPHPTQGNLAFSNVLPAGVTPVSVTPGSGTTNCTLGATTTCTLVSGIASGNNEVETIRVHVPATAVGGLADSATIDTPANPVVDAEDSNLGNNANNSNTTALAAADVAVAQAAAPNPTFAANPTTFTVTLTNPAPAAYTPATPNPIVGGSAATGVTVHNIVTVVPATSVPGGVTGITNNFGAACPASAAIAGGTATFDCTGGTIASNATNTVTFTLTPSVIGTMSATASITASAVFDPVAANNTATANDATVNTSVCAVGTCAPVTPVDPVSGNNPLTAPQATSVTFSNVTTQGSTTLAVSNQNACLFNDPTTPLQGPAGSIAALVNNSTHVPFHGNVVYGGSRTYACGSGTQPLFYDLATSAVTAGGATVCVNYSGTTFHKPDRVRMLLLTGGVTDITVAAGFSATTVCGQVPALTSSSGTVRLAVMEPSNAMPNLVAATVTVDTTSSARGSAGAALILTAVGTSDSDGPDGCNAGSSVNTCAGGFSNDANLTYTWTSGAFLNGGAKIGITPAEQPTNSTGTVQVTLTVSDPYGNSEVKVFTVSISGASGGGGGPVGSGLITTATVNKGQAASFTTDLDNGNAAVSGVIVVANAAALASNQITCSVSPSTLPAASVSNTVTVLCSTQGEVFGKLTAPKVGPEKDDMPLLAGMMGLTALPLLGMMLVPGKSRRRRLMKMWAAIGLVLMFTMFQAACGGGGSSGFGGAPQLKNPGTPSGTYQVILTPLPAGVTPSLVPNSSGTLAPAATTFTLTVQ